MNYLLTDRSSSSIEEIERPTELEPPGKRTLPKSFKLEETPPALRQVRLERDGEGYGVSIAGGEIDGSVHPVYVRQIRPNSVAARSNSLRVRDRIVSINGVAVEGMPHNDIIGLMVAAQAVDLVVEPRTKKGATETSTVWPYVVSAFAVVVVVVVIVVVVVVVG
jgi:C-terminal processing protease CtpA/Prc